MDAPAPPPLPASPAAPVQRYDDDAQLRVLSILHYVLGGLTAFFALFPLIYVALGVAMIVGAVPGEGTAADQLTPQVVGWVFVLMALLFIALGMTLAGYLIYAGRCLAQRRRHLLCMVVAGIACACMPLGTILGVFTLLVLSRSSVRERFPPARPPVGA
ncbi:hypothetical protein [Stenotrophomonas rhizophila]|uniref:hypothetical protein n=1 Tax=Stenotrophomonas rhizophila TaxID=216778 RepID=UPI001E3E03D5|nr:hypothetical protein [Stenotrophomonas rhizophila]